MAQFVVIERRHEECRHAHRFSIGRSVPNETGNRRRGPGTLEFDVDHDVPGNGVENFPKGRDRLAAACVESSEFVEREVAHRPGSIRRAVDAIVVDDDDLGARHPNVQLDPVDAVSHGARESGEGVLRSEARCTPVAYDQQAVHGQLPPNRPTLVVRVSVVWGNMLAIMSYLVLARKYRPRAFADVVGQEHVVRALSNALDSQRLHHAYLFTGTRGVGKTTLARILAACFNCEAGITSKPCGECDACTGIASGAFLDLIEVDAASRTGVDDMRGLLDNADLAPAQGRHKVYLIDEVHMLTGHSFNALLKTLEEPPEHVKFLFATTEAKKIPVTVLSRCLQFNLKNMLPEVIETQLAKILSAENIVAEPAALAVIAQAADGSMRDALSITDQAVSHGDGTIATDSVNAMLGIAGRDEIGALLDALAAGDGERLLATGDELASRSLDLASVLDELQRGFHDLAVAAELDSEPGSVYTRFRGVFSAEDLQLYYQIALMGRRDIEFAPDPKIGFDMTLLRLASFEPLANGADPDEVTGADTRVDEGNTGAETGRNESRSEQAQAPRQVIDEDARSVADATPVRKPSDNWWEIVSAMAPAGVTAMILKNSNLADQGDGSWLIRLDQAHESLLNDKQRLEIGRLATTYAGSELRVDFEIGQLEKETPMARESRIAKETREKAEATLMEDPNVQAMLNEFGGTLDSARLSNVEGEAEQPRG